jgi:hypothetical protein
MKHMNPLLLFPLLALLACGQEPTGSVPAQGNDGPTPNNTSTTPPTTGMQQGGTLIPITPSERDQWQKPEQLMAMMDNDLHGLVVADLFARDGYFTWRLLNAGAKVIAVDNDPKNIAHLEAKKKEYGLTDDQLVIRAVPVGDPGLAPGEVDVAIIVHGFATLKDRKSYFELLRRGMLEPRPLFMVEWQKGATPIGPPVSERMGEDEVMDMLGALGFSDIGAHSLRMPHQVIYLATDPIELESE